MDTILLKQKKSIYFLSGILLFAALFLSGCKKYSDPNAPFYTFLSDYKKDRPFFLERRRVNLDSSIALEVFILYKQNKDSDWKMVILKKKPDSKEYIKIIEQKLSDSEDLMDRLIVKDFFQEGFNNLSIEFRVFKNGKETGEKKFLVYRFQSILENEIAAAKTQLNPIFYKKMDYQVMEKPLKPEPAPADVSDKEKGKEPSPTDSLIAWEDTNQDGHLEIVIRKPKSEGKTEKKEEKEYAYSRLNTYKDSVLFKFNGLEFVPFQVDQPFFYYKQIILSKNLKKGEQGELVFRLVNLGAYAAKSYLTFSFPKAVTVKPLTLKNLGRIYKPGSNIFHFRKKRSIDSQNPLLEYTIFPWPNKKIYTMKIQLQTDKNYKGTQMAFLHRYSMEYRGRSLFLPDPSEKIESSVSYSKEEDQQGFPAYQEIIKLVD